MTPAPAKTLADLFEIRDRFRRSIDLKRDMGADDALDGYHITPVARSILGRILDGVDGTYSNRAITLTGPYGSGKSAFALFLANLLGSSKAPSTRIARALLKDVDQATAGRIARLKRRAGFCRILVAGTRGPLMPALCSALREGVCNFFANGAARAGLLASLVKIENPRRRHFGQEEALAGLLETLANRVDAAGGSGVLLIVDELGKFLEFAAASHEGRSDIFILQAIAERAVRCKKPIIFLTLLHQAFARYANGLSSVARDEWAKVQGRFEDVAYLDSPVQLLALASRAILRRLPASTGAYETYHHIASDACRRGLFGKSSLEIMRGLLPLHPTVALLLPAIFRSTLAQHERSLFSFLASHYAGGVAEFLQEGSASRGETSLYRLDRLYDYLVATLGPALFMGVNGKRWAEIDHLLQRLPVDRPPLASSLIKSIGLLSILGSGALTPTRTNLAFALADGNARLLDEVEDVLTSLVRASFVVHRRHNGSYALWEGSDLDLDRCYDAARAKTSHDLESLSSSTGELLALTRPWIARRHFIETGTLRYFQVKLATCLSVKTMADQPLGDADGRIIYLLPSPEDSAKGLVDAAKHIARELPTLLVIIPRDIHLLRETLVDLRAWEHVRHSTPELSGDLVARKELAARLEAAEHRLQNAFRDAFGQAALCVYRGSAHAWSGSRAASEELSAICDSVYSLAPLIRNELLNRRVLSSAASSARRELILAMLQNAHKPRLGLEVGPPEFSMYASLLEFGKLHRAENGLYGFYPPPADDPLRLSPTWTRIVEFLDQTEAHPKAICDLLDILGRPPYGLKEGPFPIILLAVIKWLGTEVALFEDGTFIPEISEPIVERLLRSPERFTIERFRIGKEREVVLRRVAECLPEVEIARPVEVVAALCKRVALLPTYARQTSRLRPAAIAVRIAISEARDPLALMFIDLPSAVGTDPNHVGTRTRRYAEELMNAIAELSAAYSGLLQRARVAIGAAFDLAQDSAAGRAELTRRAGQLSLDSLEPDLRSFVLRAADAALADSQWLESILSFLAGKPPAHWSDADEVRFEFRLREIAGLFCRAEELAFDITSEQQPQEGMIQLLRVSVATSIDGEKRRLVRVRSQDSEQALFVADRVEDLVTSLCAGRRDLALAVIGRVLERMIAHAESGHATIKEST